MGRNYTATHRDMRHLPQHSVHDESFTTLQYQVLLLKDDQSLVTFVTGLRQEATAQVQLYL